MTIQGIALRSLTTAGVALVGLGLVASLPASAEDMPRQGDFHISYTSTAPMAAKPVSIGKDKVTSAAINMMTAVNLSGGKLLHNMAGRCTTTPVIDNAAKTVENQGYCDYVDADGDHVYEQWRYPRQALGPRLEGTGEWIGGTGKFAGISGSMTISSQRLASATDGAAQFVGEKHGRYSLGEAVAAAKSD